MKYHSMLVGIDESKLRSHLQRWRESAVKHADLYMRSLSLWGSPALVSYLAVTLTAEAALTPPFAYTNIYITLIELELGSKMYIAWFSLMQFKTAKP